MDLSTMNQEQLAETVRTALGEAVAIEEKINAYKQKYLVSSPGSEKKVYAIIAVFAAVTLLGAVTRSTVLLAFGGIPAAIILITAVYVFKVQVPKHRKNCIEYAKRTLAQSAVLKHIPSEYQTAKKLEYMLSLLEDGRATTWEECMDGCKRVLG